MNILVLLWHPSHHKEDVVLGGFLRTKRILKRLPSGDRLFVIDSAPSFVTKDDHVSFFEYVSPAWFDAILRTSSTLWKICEALYSFFALLIRGHSVVRKNDIDLLYVPSSELFWITIAASLLKWRFRIPLVLCNQNVEADDFFFTLAQKINKPFHNRFANTVITVSHTLKATLEQHGFTSSIDVNTNGLDHEQFRGSVAVRPRFDGLFIGRHNPEKGVLDVLDIWVHVTLQRRDAQLGLVGYALPSMQTMLERRIAALGLWRNVTILGRVDDGQKLSLLKDSKVFVFPSHVEGWGIAPQEALAAGLPVVAYNLPVYKENIAPCDAVTLVEDSDYAAFADAVVHLLDDARYSNFRETAPACVSRFSWEDIAEREFSILHRAAS